MRDSGFFLRPVLAVYGIIALPRPPVPTTSVPVSVALLPHLHDLVVRDRWIAVVHSYGSLPPPFFELLASHIPNHDSSRHHEPRARQLSGPIGTQGTTGLT